MEDPATYSKTQVVIVGAGPTGLSLAAQLIRYKIDFIILEKGNGTTKLSKAVVVQARTLEVFDELGLAKTAIKRGRVTTGLNIFHKGKKKVSVDIAGLGKGATQFPYALSLEQSKTEALLYEYLSNNGKSVQWQSEFIRYEENENEVATTYKDASGQEQTIRSSYLVSCEGAHSLVRHQLNAVFQGDTIPKLFYVADVTLESSIINKNELFAFLIKKGFIMFFPMEGEGHYRIVGILPEQKDDNFTFEEIEPAIKKNVGVPLTFKELRWFSTYKVHSRMSSTFMKGRCFIAGDSAHIHTPAGGQGMNTGIQDAYNLAWKLAYVLNGNLKSSVLESYNTERRQNAHHLLNTTDRMFDIMAGTTPWWDFVRTKIIPLVANFVVANRSLNKKIFPLISQTGISYPDSTLTLKSSEGQINAGDRMPYFLFNDGLSSYDAIKDPVFKLIFFGDKKDNLNAFNDFKFKIKVIAFPEASETVFKTTTGLYILLRPDNYIMYIGKEISGCFEALKRISSN